MAPGETDGAQRILLIRPDHLGDAILTLPAIEALREALPRAELCALASPAAGSVLERLPALDEVRTLDFPGLGRGAAKSAASPWRLALRTARELRRRRFTAALVLRPDHWWGALIAWQAGIPQRIGFDLEDTAPFLTQALPLRREHALLRNLRLAAALSGASPRKEATLRFPVAQADRAAARALLRQVGLGGDERYLCIHPGSGSRFKHWETERWARVAERLEGTHDARVVFSGGESERGMVQDIIERMNAPALNLAGRTDVGQLAACYEGAALVLGPDSGPLHLATAVGAPTVSLYGPADPVEFGPWGPAGRHVTLLSLIACRPCRVLDWGDDDPRLHPCLRDIGVEQVLEAANALLSANESRKRNRSD